jgi:hypothetical protein
MLFKEEIGVYSGNLMKPINALCGQSSEQLTLKEGGTYIYQYSLKG